MMLLIVMVILLNSSHCLLKFQHLKKIFFFHLVFCGTAGVPLITTYKTQSEKKKNPDDLDFSSSLPLRIVNFLTVSQTMYFHSLILINNYFHSLILINNYFHSLILINNKIKV